MKNKLKLLICDLETSPNIGYFWQPGNKISIGYENIIQERAIICVSYKWYGDKKAKSFTWDKGCDKKLLKDFLKVAEEAELVLTHNGDRFDIPWLKGRLAIHGLKPLTHMTSIDTLKLSRSNFRFNSNRLDYLGKILVNDQKLKHSGFGMWKDVMAGNKKALKMMVKYCEQDVQLLEKVYDKLAPHVKTMPSISLAGGHSKSDCPVCFSSDVENWGFVYLKANKKQRIRCKTCSKTWS